MERVIPGILGQRGALLATLILPSLILAGATPPRKTSANSVPAVFLADIHLDPLHDPAKVARLNSAPFNHWPEILAEPDSPTQAADYAAVNQTCPIVPLTDTTEVLFRSTLAQLRSQRPHIRFLTISGDLVAHRFDCRFRQILPNATHAEFLSFVDKTIRYVVSNLHTALPGVPFYIALGNNDTACSDNELDPGNDELLALEARVVAEALPAADRPEILRDFPHGFYSAPLPASIRHTRILVLDDVYSMGSYKTCSGQPDPGAETPLLAWLEAQLKSARARHQHVWVMGHVPPGVNPYSTYNRHPDICGPGDAPVMFLATEKLPQVLAAYSDVISLAYFAHSHTDEMRLIRPEPGSSLPGVALKIIPSISPVFAELPSYTLAKISSRTATLRDYTVIMASNSTGVDTAWAPTYTFSTAYHQAAFTPAAVGQIISTLQSDPTMETPTSQAYLREYRHPFFDDHSTPMSSVWPQFACATDHLTAASFTACACPANGTR